MINYLPELVIKLIVNRFLNYEDIINLKLTCKKLKQIIDQIKFTKLYLYSKYHSYPHRLFHTNEFVYYASSYRINFHFEILTKFKFKQTFKHLQKLIYSGQWNFYSTSKPNLLCLDYFNEFVELKHLELERIVGLKGKLNLKNLKILRICLDGHFGQLNQFKLDCDQLKALCINDKFARGLIIKKKLILDHLTVERIYDSNSNWRKILSSIQDLSTLTICGSFDVQCLYEILVRIEQGKLSSLNEIRLEEIRELLNANDFVSYMSRYWNRSISIINDLPFINKIKIYFNSKQIWLDDFAKLSNALTKLYILDSDGYVDDRELKKINPTIDYYLLSNVYRLKILAGLDEHSVSIMKNLKYLHFTNSLKIDDELFDTLLRSNIMLMEIKMNSPFITQEQYDRMPQHIFNPIHIELGEKCKIKNFDFLIQFRNLKSCKIQKKNIKRIDLTNLLRKHLSKMDELVIIGHFHTIHFERNKNDFKIKIYFNNEFRETIHFRFLNSLIDFYYSNDLFHSDKYRYLQMSFSQIMFDALILLMFCLISIFFSGILFVLILFFGFCFEEIKKLFN